MTAVPRPASASLDEEVETLERQLDALQRKLSELEGERDGLEKEVVRRGVKLNCANIALARAKIAFDQAAERREAMVLDVSHDLRTPLTSIKGAAQNLLDGIAGPMGAGQREYVDIIREHAERLIGSVNWLVEAIRATAAPIELEARPMDLAQLVASVVRGLVPLAEESGIRLHMETEPARAAVDQDRLRKVLENLIGNALKFTPSGGEVCVRTYQQDDRAWVCVRDTGPGLSAEEAERVFDRFYRGRTTVEGSGVGLAISREIVRAHGGELTVTSGPESGCLFQAWLPQDFSDV